MNSLRNILLTIVIVMLVSLLVAGCAVHAEATMGAGSGTKYGAAMSGRRGAGIDFPADAKEISSKSEMNVNRPARND